MIKIDNILVPTDFSEASDSALAYARAFARTFNARLHVLHVVDDAVMFAGIDGYSLDVSSVLAGMIDDGEKQILTRLSEADWREPKTITDVRAGGPAIEIVKYANETGVDLIIMGSHGRGFMSGLLMGRVAEKIVRTAPCPVLTVRSPERDFALRQMVHATAHLARRR